MRLLGAACVALSLVRCDPPSSPASSPPPARDAARPARPAEPAPPEDRTVVRKTITYYRWLRTDPAAASADGRGVDHGTAHLTLVVEVHRNPRNEGWIMAAALGPQVAIPENTHFVAEGASAEWHLPPDGYNDPRTEIFAGEVRADEPLRVYLAANPEAVLTLTPATSPGFVRLPATGVLPALRGVAPGQYDAVLVAVIPMRNRRGGRYLLQVLDLQAEPGGFGQNGVLTHPPDRDEIQRFTRWMRDPQRATRDRGPPLAIRPIDRN